MFTFFCVFQPALEDAIEMEATEILLTYEVADGSYAIVHGRYEGKYPHPFLYLCPLPFQETY